MKIEGCTIKNKNQFVEMAVFENTIFLKTGNDYSHSWLIWTTKDRKIIKWRQKNSWKWKNDHKIKNLELKKWPKMDPFTNEPYAFDDQGSSADPREADFNNGIREITVRKIPEIASL